MKFKIYFSITLFLISFSFSETVKQDSIIVGDKWLTFDKVQHFTYSFLWTLSSQYILVNNMNFYERDAIHYSVFSSASAGVMKEIYDMQKPKGYLSKKDLLANSLGIVLACLVIQDNIKNDFRH